MRVYLWIAIVFATATVGLLAAFGPTARTLFDIAIVVTSLLPAIFRATPKLYIWWTKARFWAANSPATWELNIRFQQFASDASLSTISAVIRRLFTDMNVLAETSARAVIRTRRFVIELSAPIEGADVPNTEREISLSVAPVTVGYRDSRRFLEEQLLPMIEAIRDDLGARWASYSLRVDLPEKNPYLGLYLQTFAPVQVQEFRIQLTVPRSATTKIVVGKERMTVIADTIEQFRRAVAAALAFRVPEA